MAVVQAVVFAQNLSPGAESTEIFIYVTANPASGRPLTGTSQGGSVLESRVDIAGRRRSYIIITLLFSALDTF